MKQQQKKKMYKEKTSGHTLKYKEQRIDKLKESYQRVLAHYTGDVAGKLQEDEIVFVGRSFTDRWLQYLNFLNI